MSTRAAELEAENLTLREARDAAARAPVPVVSPPSREDLRVVVILVFAIGLIPCNAVSRCFEVLCRAGWLALSSIPHPSSVVNWVARAGLGRLLSVGKIAAPWVAIIDSSISYGKAKMLVVLRVPLAHFAQGKGAVGLADTECISLAVRESWTGDDVKDQLLRTFDAVGLPVAIVKDQGADLKRGVDLLRKEHKGIAVVRDVGHVFALLLKREYEHNPVFERFLKLIDSARARLCHSDVAALRPPKIRAKGRFQSISRVVDWANRMAEILAGAGRPTKGSLRERVLHAMPKLTAMRFFFARFSRDCATLNSIMELLKTHGLNQETHKAAVELLRALPVRSRIRRSIKAWLDESLRTHCRLSVGQIPLLVSTDALESLYGLVKMILERLPAPEFGTLSLATPLFCGTLTEHIVREALERCPHERLTEWKSENLGHTKRRVQTRLLEEVRRNTGPDPEPAVSA